MWIETHRCCVEGCPSRAAYGVVLYDVDLHEGGIRFEQDETCPYICVEHMIDNERHAIGDRRPEERVDYPYTNRNRVRGMSVYRPLLRTGVEETELWPASSARS